MQSTTEINDLTPNDLAGQIDDLETLRQQAIGQIMALLTPLSKNYIICSRLGFNPLKASWYTFTVRGDKTNDWNYQFEARETEDFYYDLQRSDLEKVDFFHKLILGALVTKFTEIRDKHKKASGEISKLKSELHALTKPEKAKEKNLN